MPSQSRQSSLENGFFPDRQSGFSSFFPATAPTTQKSTALTSSTPISHHSHDGASDGLKTHIYPPEKRDSGPNTALGYMSGAHDCCPPGFNGLPSALAASGGPGQGVSSRLSNFDNTGSVIVKRGLTVAFKSLRGKVIKVNRGHCWVNWAGGLQNAYEKCESLRVIPIAHKVTNFVPFDNTNLGPQSDGSECVHCCELCGLSVCYRRPDCQGIGFE